MTSAPPMATPGIADALRAATAHEHRHAESRGYVTRLMGGELSLGEYARYLAQFARIYAALESRVAVAGDPPMLHDGRLARTAVIDRDLEALGFPDWATAFPALDATTAYAERLRALGPFDGVCHLAHHYTRYLGDLSGGQAIATMLRRHYAATESQLGFFSFPEIGNVVHYKRSYREQLDALTLTTDELDLLMSESRRAFALNAAVFDELDVDVEAVRVD